MGKENEIESIKAEARFKDMVFASNPTLYEAIFPEDIPPDVEDPDFEWIHPESEEEVAALMAELAAAS